jgi:hypothetical protein
LQNFRQHASRLRQVAEMLADGGIRLGLDYVAPKTSWVSGRYPPFIHTLAEMKGLVAEINLSFCVLQLRQGKSHGTLHRNRKGNAAGQPRHGTRLKFADEEEPKMETGRHNEKTGANTLWLGNDAAVRLIA